MDHIKEILQHIPDAPHTMLAFSDENRYMQLEETLAKFKICISLTTNNRGQSHCKMGRDVPSIQRHGPDVLTIEAPSLSPSFVSPSALRQISVSHELLEPLDKACLLCCAAFPEEKEINKRTLIHFWIGLELIALPAGSDGQEIGHEVLETLVEHGFVEDVITKEKITSRCRVSPFIRSLLVNHAIATKFFEFLVENNDADYADLSCGDKRRVCLLTAPKYGTTTFSCWEHLRRNTELMHIETLFNVNKRYLEIKLRWFMKMKNIRVLYLGRCDASSMERLEVKSTKFLEGLRYMRKLRFLSLRGLSKIIKLPDSVGAAKNLRILDLRDCYDLEELPEAVKSLDKLTYLDLSGCYSLARMPRGIASLSELRVLKGFFIKDTYAQQSRHSCSFQDLRRLKKLRKLSITTSIRRFPDNNDIKIFSEMGELRNLKIAWRLLYWERSAAQLALPQNQKIALLGLEKLHLQHIPYERAPSWLVSDKLQSLKKLYLEGGRFLETLGEERHPRWPVEALRLKYLPELKMDWLEVQNTFPRLSYVEQVTCPNLTSFPCNGDGVWQTPS